MEAADLMPPPDPVNEPRATGLIGSLESIAKQLLETQVAGFQGEVPGWIGEAADTYTDSIRTLGGRIRDIAASIGVCGSHLHEWADSVGNAATKAVPDLHLRYDEAQAEYERRIQAITEELLSPSEPMTQRQYDRMVENFAAERVATEKEILNDYKKLMTELDDLAAKVATSMKATLDQEIGVEGWIDGGGGRDELGTLLFNGIPVVDGQAEYERAQELAREAATYFDEHDTLTPERVLEFHEKYGDRLDDPFFAVALSEVVSPQEMLQFASDADHLRNGPSAELSQLAVSKEYRTALEEIAAGLGYAVTLSTGGFDAAGDVETWEAFRTAHAGLRTEDGLTMVEHQRAQVEEWKKAGSSALEMDRFNSPNLPDLWQYDKGYEYLGYMLAAAGNRHSGLALGPEFFNRDGGNSLADELLIFERDYYQAIERGETKKDNFLPQISVDGTYRTAGFSEGMFSLMDDPVPTEYGPARIQRSWPGFEAAETARLDAIRAFMTSGVPAELTTGEKLEDPLTMTRHLTGHRWSPAMGETDGGDSLGKLIRDLSVPRPLPDDSDIWRERAHSAAQIAAEFIEGYQDGLERHGINPSNGRYWFGDGNKVLRNWAGQIIAPYLPGMAATISLNTSSGDSVRVSTESAPDYTLSVDKDFISRLREEHGLFRDLALDDGVTSSGGKTTRLPNPPASEVLMAESLRQYDRDLESALTATGDRRAKAHRAITKWASILGMIDGSSTEAHVSQGAAKDAMNRRIKMLANAGIGKIDVGDLFSSDEKEQGNINKGFQKISTGVLDAIFSEDAALKALKDGDESHNSTESILKFILMAKFYSGFELAEGDSIDFKEACKTLENNKGFPDGIPEELQAPSVDAKQRELIEQKMTDHLADKGNEGEEYALLLTDIDKELNTAKQEQSEG